MDILWSPPPPAPAPGAMDGVLDFLADHQPILKALGGAGLLLEGKHCKHTVLFLQAFYLVAAPGVARATAELKELWAKTRAAAASLTPEELATAERLRAAAATELRALRHSSASFDFEGSRMLSFSHIYCAISSDREPSDGGARVPWRPLLGRAS